MPLCPGPALARLFSVQQPPALVFVIDTTGSMFEEINAARLRALAIIQGRAESSAGQPGTYLLVPFHDPGEDCLSTTAILHHFEGALP